MQSAKSHFSLVLHPALWGLVFHLLTGGLLHAQDIPSKLEYFYAKYPVEKVHLHFDKAHYSVNDTIWFKAYLVNAKHELTIHSKVLNIDLIDESGIVVQSLKVPLVAGLSWGSIVLGNGITEGNYRIRAYTNWMRNFSDEYFFDKVIAVNDLVSADLVSTIQCHYSGRDLLADLRFMQPDGIPFADAELNYSISSGSENLVKEKGNTDGEGRIRIRANITDSLSAVYLQAELTVSGKPYSKRFILMPGSTSTDLQFFPEGGDMVNHIPSRVAFKALGGDGLGKAVSGYISDDSDTSIVPIRTSHAGMGVFELTPLAGYHYTAHLATEDGPDLLVKLPEAKESGTVLRVLNEQEYLRVRIRSSQNLVGKKMTLVVQSGDQVYGQSSGIIEEGALDIRIPKASLPTGISRITVFIGSGIPLAERLVFIDHRDRLGIDLKTDQEIYHTGDQAVLELATKTPDGKPVLASLSVSVTDQSRVPFNEEEETTILSNLLLSSELKGYIEKPNYYFIDNDSVRVHQLDILMMTQGWRRFEWKEILSGTLPDFRFKPETGLSVSGQVSSILGEPSDSAKVNLIIPGSGRPLSTVADSKGEFRFDSLDFEDNTGMILQAHNKKGRPNVQISLHPTPPLGYTMNKNRANEMANINNKTLSDFEDSADYLEELRRIAGLQKMHVLKEVKVTAFKKHGPENSSNLNNKKAAYTLKSEDVQGYVNLGTALQSKIPGVLIIQGKAFLPRNMTAVMSGPVPMAVYLDGVFLNEEEVKRKEGKPAEEIPPSTTALNTINTADIESIEFLTNVSELAVYGAGAFGGAILTQDVAEAKNGIKTTVS